MTVNLWNATDQKGQVTINTMFGMLFLGLFFYVWLMIWQPIMNEMVYPELDNVAYGTIIRLMFEFGPLIMAILIFAYPFLQSQAQNQGTQQIYR
jgi:hypothetical protein